MKRYGKGWYGESYRHYLASKGIMSSGADLMMKSNMFGRTMNLRDAYDKGASITPWVGHEGGEILPRAFKAGEDERLMPASEREGERFTGGAYEGARKYAAAKCPMCGKSVGKYPALSRRGDYEICSDCGTAEALEDWQHRDKKEYMATKEELAEIADKQGLSDEQKDAFIKLMSDRRPDIHPTDSYAREWAWRIGQGRTHAWQHAGGQYAKSLMEAGYAPEEEAHVKKMMEYNYPTGSVSPEEAAKGEAGIRQEFRERKAMIAALPKEPGMTYKDSVKIVKVK